MKFIILFALYLMLIYFIHETSGDTKKVPTTAKPSSKSTKVKGSAPIKTTRESNSKTKEHTKKTVNDRSTSKEKPKIKKNDPHTQSTTSKAKKTPNIRTPFDKVLEKLSTCALSSPSLVDVMQENLEELQSDEKYTPLFNAAPHTAAFINKRAHDSSKFISGLRQALNADWSNPTWKSWNEIDTLFRPFKQQFVYAMMRFNCT